MKLKARVPRISVLFASVLLTVILLGIFTVEAKQPNINKHGDLAWVEWDGNDYELYLYYKGTVTQITDNAHDA